MVVTVHALASQVGVTILQQGGNAVDAAVATGFRAGGGAFACGEYWWRRIYADPHGRRQGAHFLDYREKAPAVATRDMYLDAQGNVIPGAG